MLSVGWLGPRLRDPGSRASHTGASKTRPQPPLGPRRNTQRETALSGVSRGAGRGSAGRQADGRGRWPAAPREQPAPGAVPGPDSLAACPRTPGARPATHDPCWYHGTGTPPWQVGFALASPTLVKLGISACDAGNSV